MGNPKIKISITVEKKILERAKEVSKEKNIPLSRVIENFLKFFSNPWVYCFKCGKKFFVTDAEVCPKCGWLKCPFCGACRCDLNEEVASAVYYMRKVYEELLVGRVK